MSVSIQALMSQGLLAAESAMPDPSYADALAIMTWGFATTPFSSGNTWGYEFKNEVFTLDDDDSREEQP